MPNPWVEFVREYAKKNNITYMCAISKAKDEYRAMKEGKKKVEKVEPKKVIEKKAEPEVQITYGVKKSKPIKEKVIEKKVVNKYAYIPKEERKQLLKELNVNKNAMMKQYKMRGGQGLLMEIEQLDKRIKEIEGYD